MFTIVATIAFLILGCIWKTEANLNLLVKIALILLAVWGGVTLMNSGGVHFSFSVG